MNPIKIIQLEQGWQAEFRYDQDTKEVVKGFGFKWYPKEKQWKTSDPAIASGLADAMNDHQAKVRIAEVEQIRTKEDKRAYDMSFAKFPNDNKEFKEFWKKYAPPKGLRYLEYQKAFVEWWMQRQTRFRSLLCSDEMGVGKTVQSCALFSWTSKACAEYNGRPPRFLVICTAGMKINWLREIEKWCPDLSVSQVTGTKPLEYVPDDDVVIINYDLVMHHRRWIDKIADNNNGWDLVVCDEAHYLKNPRAKRTMAVLGGNLGTRANPEQLPHIRGNKLFLTGTPLVNRPVELWPIVKECDPIGLGENWQRFVRKYCGAFKDKYGWNTSGATNLDELQVKLRSTIMIRRRTNEVLDQLPLIRRQAIVLPENGSADLLRAEWEAYHAHEKVLEELEKARINTNSDMRGIVRTLTDQQAVTWAELARARKAVGIGKSKHVVEHVKNVIDSRGKVVLFSWHKDVVNALMEGLKEFKPVRFTGSDSQLARQASVDSFQTEEDTKVIVLNLEAGGVGITLTGSEQAGFCTSVVFSELDWRPSIMQQAERRVARLGADESADHILVHHVVLDGSLDATISNRLIDKQDVIDQAIN